MEQFSQWAKHVRRASWPQGAIIVRWGLTILLVGLVAALYLAQASQMSAIGRNLEKMRAEYDLLKRNNAELLEQIAQDGSIPRLQQRSAELGLVPAQQVKYLSVPVMPPVIHSSPWPDGQAQASQAQQP